MLRSKKMDIYWFGQSCFKIKGKNASLLIDPFKADFTGLKFPKDLEATVVLSTHSHEDHNNISDVMGHPLVIAGAGEYEISGISVNGISTFHDNRKGALRGKNTIYHIFLDGINFLHLGDLGHLLSEEQTSLIDTDIDVLMIPIGGVYTLDAKEAAKEVAELEPKIVIPMHYQIPGLKFELGGLEPFLKEMGLENIEPVSKLFLSRDKLPEETTVVVLNKS